MTTGSRKPKDHCLLAQSDAPGGPQRGSADTYSGILEVFLVVSKSLCSAYVVLVHCVSCACGVHGMYGGGQRYCCACICDAASGLLRRTPYQPLSIGVHHVAQMAKQTHNHIHYAIYTTVLARGGRSEE